MRRTRWQSTVAPLCAALAVAACGGINTRDEPSGAEARLIAQMNPICRTANDAADAVGSPTDPAGRLEAARKLLDIRQRELDAMRALRAPSGSYQDYFDTFTVWLENLVSDHRFIVLRLEEGNVADADKFTRDATEARRQMRDAAERLRADDCAET